MARAQSIDLVFPFGGLDRRNAYQNQPPYTTQDCLNVWPSNVADRRRSGGSRPGTARVFDVSPVRLIDPVPSLTDPDNSAALLPAYTVDGLHFSAAGNAVVAALVDTYLAARPTTTETVILVGDSLTAGGWPALCTTPGKTMQNEAVGGSWITNVRTVIANVVVPADPELLIVWVGTNDMNGTELEPLKASYTALINDVRAWGGDVWYFTIAPRSFDATKEARRIAFNEWLVTAVRESNEINLLNTVSWVPSGGAVSTNNSEQFNSGFPSSVWSAASFLATDGLPTGASSRSTNVTTTSSTAQNGAVRTAITGLPAAYTVQLNIPLERYTDRSGAYRLYARMDDTSPDASTSGLIIEMNLTYAGYAEALPYTFTTRYKVDGGAWVNGGSGSLSRGQSNETQAIILSISSDTAWAYVAGLATIIPWGTSIATHTGKRLGFGLEANATGYPHVSYFNFSYTTTSTSTNTGLQTAVVAASNGQLYYSIDGSTMTAVGASDALATGIYIQAAERTGKLYIANYSNSDGAVVPKIYDPSAGTVSTWTATSGKGTVPTRCKVICRYRDRMVLAGSVTNPWLWYMSRLGDPLDWDYSQLSADDTGSAVSGALSESGDIGSPIMAAIPYADDYLVFGCTDELWVLRGDPGYGGTIDNLSRKVGIIDRFAWTLTPEGHIVFLSKDGLYLLSAGAASIPQSISREKLPEELLNINPDQFIVTMAYDVEYRGVHIAKTDPNGGPSTHWFFDWEDKSFWPVQFPVAQEPTQMHFAATPFVRGVMMGCKDGYIRQYSNTSYTDDGTDFSSYLKFGPIRMGGSTTRYGMLTEIVGIIHPLLGPVDWEVHTSESDVGLALNPTTAASGTWTVGTEMHGRSYSSRPMCRGASMSVKLSQGNDGQAWGIENVMISRKPFGVHQMCGR